MLNRENRLDRNPPTITNWNPLLLLCQSTYWITLIYNIWIGGGISGIWYTWVDSTRYDTMYDMNDIGMNIRYLMNIWMIQYVHIFICMMIIRCLLFAPFASIRLVEKIYL